LPQITDKLLQLFDETSTQATFFCLGWVAQQYPHLIRQIHQAGHEIAAHSFWHHKVSKQSLADFKADLHKNILVLEEITGEKVRSYRAPAFTLFPFSPHAIEALLNEGILYDSTVLAGMNISGTKLPNRPFRIADNELLYFPVSTVGIFGKRIPYAGSGYFRLLPQTFVRYKLSQPGYHMLYFHPRDLDAGLRHTNTFSSLERLRFLPGTHQSLPRLKSLLQQFQMQSISQAAATSAKNDLLISINA